MRKESVLKMARGVAAGVLLGLETGLPALARAEALRWEETLPALRIQVDASRHRVWVLNLDGVYLYDSRTRKLAGRVELPEWVVVNEAFVCVPDLVIAASGAALVTSNILPVIWEIDGASMAVRQHKLTLDADNDKDVGFTALSFGRDGRDLLAVSSHLGSTWRIDLAADSAQKVQFANRIRGTCGLALQQ
jgi:hypothetical protein